MITVRERRPRSPAQASGAQARQTCPLCLERVGVLDAEPCAGCGTLQHGVCLRELGGCGTLGCPARSGLAWGWEPDPDHPGWAPESEDPEQDWLGCSTHSRAGPLRRPGPREGWPYTHRQSRRVERGSRELWALLRAVGEGLLLELLGVVVVLMAMPVMVFVALTETVRHLVAAHVRRGLAAGSVSAPSPRGTAVSATRGA